MLNYANFAITLARAVASLRDRPDAVPEHKAALRALFALTTLAPAAVTIEGGRLAVEGVKIPVTLPLIPELSQRLLTHAVREIRFAQNASAADLLRLLRALAAEPAPAGSVDGLPLRDLTTAGVSVVCVPPERMEEGRRPAGVTDAFQTVVWPELRPEPAPVSAPRRPTPPRVPRPTPPPTPGRSPLETAIDRLADPPGPGTLRTLLHEVGNELTAAIIAGDLGEVIPALTALIAREAKVVGDHDAAGEYDHLIRRVLDPPLLEEVGRMVADPRHRTAAAAILRRSGEDGREVLIQRLATALTPAARAAYFQALGGPREAREIVLQLLDHSEWMVVRTAAELLGELGVAEAIPALAKGLAHYEVEVREAAGAALARIGTTAAVEPLRRALRDSDPEVRLTVADAIGGASLGGLVSSLASTAESERSAELKRAYYRALGRIGTPDAVQVLIKAAQPGGRFIGRRPASPRLAAIDGLRLAGGPAAIGTLQGLLSDGDPEIREAARIALGEARARRPPVSGA